MTCSFPNCHQMLSRKDHMTWPSGRVSSLLSKCCYMGYHMYLPCGWFLAMIPMMIMRDVVTGSSRYNLHRKQTGNRDSIGLGYTGPLSKKKFVLGCKNYGFLHQATSFCLSFYLLSNDLNPIFLGPLLAKLA